MKHDIPHTPADLRKQAESKLSLPPELLASTSPEETQRLLNELRVHQIEWMLSKSPTPSIAGLSEDHDQGYGDLTELNRNGIILKFIGLEHLKGLAEDYLGLLGTSSAIYEANGDYAFGIFASGWCRMMDCASRNLCATSDNAAAINSGRWLCHESCWTDCCKQVVADGAPVDIECHGGIRIFAVPIMAHGNVVGAMNFGYGDPPIVPEKLHRLAETYHLDYDDLVRAAHAYGSRPPFIIELAKKRLQATARLIGAMIETKQSEEALRESEDRFRTLFNQAPLGYQSLDEEGRFIEVNPAWLETLGYRRDEVIGKWFGDFLAPEFIDAFRARFPLFKAKGRIHAEFQMLHRNGERRFIAFEGRIGYQPDGTFKQTHCILSDITELKDTEAQKAAAFETLQEEKDKLYRWQSLTVGRELAMIELKKEVNALLKQAGQPDKYEIVEGKTA